MMINYDDTDDDNDDDDYDMIHTWWYILYAELSNVNSSPSSMGSPGRYTFDKD